MALSLPDRGVYGENRHNTWFFIRSQNQDCSSDLVAVYLEIFKYISFAVLIDVFYVNKRDSMGLLAQKTIYFSRNVT